jgi:Spy/CpxP family protein refolding chaperone
MKRPSLILLAAFALACLGLAHPAPAQAQPGAPHGRHGGDGHDPEGFSQMADRLDLTDAQRTQLHDIVSRYHSGPLGDAMKGMMAARGQVEGLVADPTATEDQIVQASKSAAALSEQAMLLRHRMAVEIDSILTDAQKQKAKDLRAERAAEHGPGGPWHGGGPRSN